MFFKFIIKLFKIFFRGSSKFSNFDLKFLLFFSKIAQSFFNIYAIFSKFIFDCFQKILNIKIELNLYKNILKIKMFLIATYSYLKIIFKTFQNFLKNF